MDIAISKNDILIRLTDERWMIISTGHPEIADYYYEILKQLRILKRYLKVEMVN